MTTTRRGLVVNLISETVGGSVGHGVHTAFLQTRAALERAGVSVRVNSPESCDIIHIETMGPLAVRMLLTRPERAVVTAHIVPDSLVGSFQLAPMWLPVARAYMRAIYEAADEVLAVSPDVIDGLRAMGVTAPARVVPNAIDVDWFTPEPGWRERTRAALGIPSDAFLVISTGQVQPRKGVDTFIAVARELPDVVFLWVGGMPFKRLTAGYGEMRSLVRSAPRNVRFLGQVDYDEMPHYYAAADCLLFCSRQETFGFSIVEAAAAGLPLILRDLSTYRPLFGDAYIGGDEGSFAELVAAVRDDANLRETYGRKARTLAHRYGLEAHGLALLDAYEEVLLRREDERPSGARRRPASVTRHAHPA